MPTTEAQLQQASKAAKSRMLFYEFESVALSVQRLNGIVQNDIKISPEQLGAWLAETDRARTALDSVILLTTNFVREGQNA